MPQVIEILKRGVTRQAENVRTFMTTPTGPFETLDKVVRNSRSTAREVVASVGVTIPAAPRILRR